MQVTDGPLSTVGSGQGMMQLTHPGEAYEIVSVGAEGAGAGGMARLQACKKPVLEVLVERGAE